MGKISDGSAVVHRITGGPSKFSVMNAVLDEDLHHKVEFRTEKHGSITMNVAAFEKVREHGRFDHWEMKGYFWWKAKSGSSTRCTVLFWPDLKEGILHELGPEPKKMDLSELDRLTDSALVAKLAESKKLSQHFLGSFQDDRGTLLERDQLLIDILFTENVARGALDAVMKFGAYRRTRV